MQVAAEELLRIIGDKEVQIMFQTRMINDLKSKLAETELKLKENRNHDVAENGTGGRNDR